MEWWTQLADRHALLCPDSLFCTRSSIKVFVAGLGHPRIVKNAKNGCLESVVTFAGELVGEALRDLQFPCWP
eukprot:90018-Pelagomonas_calceolata.AAC.3